MTEQNIISSFINSGHNWFNSDGPLSEIVFSSRIRLARNFSGYKFSAKCDPEAKKAILENIETISKQLQSLSGLFFVKMDNLSALDRQFLMERHLISREHTIAPDGKGLLISDDERISIMVNEEDHLRIQVIMPGFNLKKCWDTINIIDDEISSKFPYAFSNDIGYLTACPTNTGTGIRVSSMLHLPALVISKKINKILNLVSNISFTTRGFFGEGTQALGDFFQVSNQVSLGVSEEELIKNLSSLVAHIVELEVDERKKLLTRYRLSLEDNVYRAIALLKNARLINSQEALGHLSMLSLGLSLGIINEAQFSCDRDKLRHIINSLFILIQPAHLQLVEDKNLNAKERDFIRAAIIREKLQ